MASGPTCTAHSTGDPGHYYDPGVLAAHKTANISDALSKGAPSNSTVRHQLACSECPDGSECLGGGFLPVARVGWASLAHSSGDAPKFVRCTYARGCAGGSYNTTPIVAYMQNISVYASGGASHLALARLGVRTLYSCADGHLNGSALCTSCDDQGTRRAHFALTTASGCSSCKFPRWSYLLLASGLVILWFPALKFLDDHIFPSSDIWISFIQFLGVYSYVRPSLGFKLHASSMHSTARLPPNLLASQMRCSLLLCDRSKSIGLRTRDFRTSSPLLHSSTSTLQP